MKIVSPTKVLPPPTPKQTTKYREIKSPPSNINKSNNKYQQRFLNPPSTVFFWFVFFFYLLTLIILSEGLSCFEIWGNHSEESMDLEKQKTCSHIRVNEYLSMPSQMEYGGVD